MSDTIVIDGEAIWTADDESFLQEHMDNRDQEKRDKDAAIQFANRLWRRHQESVEILVDHPFRGLRWEILYELPDAPNFYKCVCCSNLYHQAFHSSELLLTTRNN